MDLNRRDMLRTGVAFAAASALPGLVFAKGGAAKGKKPAPKPKGPRLIVRRAKDRGRGSHGGWLEARHTFSFSRYRDPAHMGFRALRVMNEDVIQESKGFAMHPHKDMEILTYVLGGALKHKDSLGNGGVIVPGEVQRMSAGRGIRHSEVNPSKKDDTHLYQIWMHPTHRGTKPSYAEQKVPFKDRKGVLKLIASPTGAHGSISMGTNVNLYSALLAPKQVITYPIPKQRHVWIQIARGSVQVNGQLLHRGDGVRTSDAGTLKLTGLRSAELLLFDLA